MCFTRKQLLENFEKLRFSCHSEQRREYGGKTAAHDQLATEYTYKFNDVNVPMVYWIDYATQLRCLGFPEFYNQYTTQHHWFYIYLMKDPNHLVNKKYRWCHPTWIVHSNIFAYVQMYTICLFPTIFPLKYVKTRCKNVWALTKVLSL